MKRESEAGILLEGTGLKNSVGAGWLKRASLLVALVVLMGAFLATVTILPGIARAATLYVGGIGPGNYTRIQYAIENATAGDTIFIYSGTYVEQVEVDKALSLVGEDRNTTIIDGGGQGTVVNVTADGVNITGLSVTNSSSDGFDAGFVLYGVWNCNIIGNNVTTNGGSGIYSYASRNNTIEDNEVYSNQRHGLYSNSSSNSTVVGNTFTGNALGDITFGAITFVRSVNTTIAGNIVTGGGGSHMIGVFSSDRATIANNTLGPSTSNGIHIEFSTNTTIVNNTVLSHYFGVDIYSSRWNSVVGNTLRDSGSGVVIREGAVSNSIENNTIVGGGTGIDLDISPSNLVAHNNISLSLTGIYGSGSNYTEIRFNTLETQQGIALRSSENSTISNNTLSSTSGYGIGLLDSTSNAVADNTILVPANNPPAIALYQSQNVRLDRNVMTGGGVYILGYYVGEWNTHTIDASNTVNGSPVYYWKNATGGTLPGGAGQVLLANCSEVAVEGQDLSDVNTGIQIGFSSALLIANNTVSGTETGIFLTSSSNNSLLRNSASFNADAVYLLLSGNNTLAYNTASDNGAGFKLDQSGNNTLSQNVASHNTLEGIRIYYSDNNTLAGNNASENLVGILLAFAGDDRILNNTIVGNEWGIQADGPRQTIVGNTISNNALGLALATSFRVHHNNFLNNTQQVSSGGVAAFWDDGYPSGGNFWSDYRGFDNWSGPNQDLPGGDGIGDTPYIIPGGSPDRYPLMYPVTSPPWRPSAPRNLQATASDRQVALTWEVPDTDGGSTITNYTVYRGALSGGEAPLVDLGVVLTYTDTGLTNGQAYYYKVAAKNAVGAGPASNEAPATPFTFPGAPLNLTAAGADRQVVLSWSPPADDGGFPVTNYVVYRGFTPGGEGFLVRLGNVSTYTDSGLTNGVTCYYTVAAVSMAGEGPNSTEASATPWTLPSAPRNLNAVAGAAQVILTWTTPATDGGSPITNYRVYRGTSPGGETFLLELGNVLTYVDPGLTNGVTYYYRVSARTAFGEGPLSSEVQATPAVLPGAPASLVAIAGVRQITLYWSPPASDGGSAITGYRIYRGTAPGGETLLTTVGTVTTYPDTGLPEGQTFYYKVAAVNGLGEGPQSGEASATTASRSLQPLFPRATAGDGRVTLRWDVPMWDGGSAITGYRIYRGTVSGSETPLILLGVVYTHVDTGLANGVTYYYKVAAVNGVGEGPLSDEASATPATFPTMPLSLLAVAGRGEVTLNWTVPSSDGGSPVTGYRIYRGTSPGGETFLNDAGSAPTYTDRGLVCGRTFYYQVTAVNAAGEGPRSDEASATPVTLPGPPRFLVATAAGQQVTLRWSEPTDDGGSAITGYRVHRGTAAGGETFLTAVGPVLTYVDSSVAVGVTYYYEVSAVNAVGEGERSVEAKVAVANQPPTCVVQAPGEADILFGTHSISGTAQDADGTVVKVEVRIDNGAWVTATGTDLWSYGWDTRSITDGVHTIHARAFDGKAYSEEATVTVIVRNAVPPPPPEAPVWLQAWFWVLIVVLVVAAVVAYRYMQKKPRGKEPEE